MTLTFNPQLENASLNAIRDAIDSGDGPGAIELYAGVTLIASLELPKPSFSNESGGQSFLKSPAQGAAVAAGQPDSFKFVTSYGATVFTGAVPADLVVDFTPSGAAVVASFVLTEGVVQAPQFASTRAYPYQEPLPELPELPYIWFDASDASTFTLDGADVDGWQSKGIFDVEVYPLYTLKPEKGPGYVYFPNDANIEEAAPAALYSLQDIPAIDNGHLWTIFIVASEIGLGEAWQCLVTRGIDSPSSTKFFDTRVLSSTDRWATYLRDGAGDDIAEVSDTRDLTKIRLLRSEYQSSSLVFDIDNGLYNASSAIGTSLSLPPDRIFLGSNRKSPPSYLGSSFEGKLHEVLMYNKTLSATEIADVNAYLNAKWGVY